jgi:hypothetical protein
MFARSRNETTYISIKKGVNRFIVREIARSKSPGEEAMGGLESSAPAPFAPWLEADSVEWMRVEELLLKSFAPGCVRCALLTLDTAALRIG